MQTMQSSRGLSLGRGFVGIVALAAALAYGPLAETAPVAKTDPTGATGCKAIVAPAVARAAVPAASGVEWSTSPTMPGKPY